MQLTLIKKKKITPPNGLNFALYGLKNQKYNGKTLKTIKPLENGRLQVKFADKTFAEGVDKIGGISVKPSNVCIIYEDRKVQTFEGLTNVFSTFLGLLKPNGRVLEVGCGIGLSLKALQVLSFFESDTNSLTAIELEKKVSNLCRHSLRSIN